MPLLHGSSRRDLGVLKARVGQNLNDQHNLSKPRFSKIFKLVRPCGLHVRYNVSPSGLLYQASFGNHCNRARGSM